MDVSVEQVRVFLAVVEHGSFSAAARHLERGQTAVTYTIQKLESLVGKELFDRSKYRPELSDAGRALVPYARRIAEDVGAFAVQAHSIAGGLETELTLAVDSMFPMSVLLSALKRFQDRFPTVQPRVYVESLGSTAKLVVDGICAAGLAVHFVTEPDLLARTPLTEVELIMVAAPTHPLARLRGPLSADVLRAHVQLVLTDRSGLTGSREFSVHATRIWRLADLGAKHAMLKAGIGFGSMPAHMIGDDLKTRKLRRLVLAATSGEVRMPVLPLCAITRLDKPVGPATRWMIEHLREIAPPMQARALAAAALPSAVPRSPRARPI